MDDILDEKYIQSKNIYTTLDLQEDTKLSLPQGIPPLSGLKDPNEYKLLIVDKQNNVC